LEFEGLDGERLIKVGSSHSPRARAITICGQTDLVLVGAAVIGVGENKKDRFANAMSLEFGVHRHLAEMRIELEWFRVPGGLDQVIDAAEIESREYFESIYVSRM